MRLTVKSCGRTFELEIFSRMLFLLLQDVSVFWLNGKCCHDTKWAAVSRPSPELWPGDPAPGWTAGILANTADSRCGKTQTQQEAGTSFVQKNKEALKSRLSCIRTRQEGQEGIPLSKDEVPQHRRGRPYSPLLSFLEDSPKDLGLCSSLRVQMDQKPKFNFHYLGFCPLSIFFVYLLNTGDPFSYWGKGYGDIEAQGNGREKGLWNSVSVLVDKKTLAQSGWRGKGVGTQELSNCDCRPGPGSTQARVTQVFISSSASLSMAPLQSPGGPRRAVGPTGSQNPSTGWWGLLGEGNPESKVGPPPGVLPVNPQCSELGGVVPRSMGRGRGQGGCTDLVGPMGLSEPTIQTIIKLNWGVWIVSIFSRKTQNS